MIDWRNPPPAPLEWRAETSGVRAYYPRSITSMSDEAFRAGYDVAPARPFLWSSAQVERAMRAVLRARSK